MVPWGSNQLTVKQLPVTHIIIIKVFVDRRTKSFKEGQEDMTKSRLNLGFLHQVYIILLCII